MITKLIFVCTENTYQSPIAETIFKNINRDLDLLVCSRGLVVLFPEPVNPKAETVLATHGMLIENYTTKQFRKEEVDEETLILTMTIAQKRRLATDFFINDNAYTIKEFAGEHGDVTDPYGQNTPAYEACFSELFTLMHKVIYRLLYGHVPEESSDLDSNGTSEPTVQ